MNQLPTIKERAAHLVDLLLVKGNYQWDSKGNLIIYAEVSDEVMEQLRALQLAVKEP